MIHVPLAGGLPLLRKELTEQAARKRTYLLRTGFALVFFLVSWYFLSSSIADFEWKPQLAMGTGRKIFDIVLSLSFLAVFLFLPVPMAAAIPAERKQGDLDLLWITDLSPLEILLEKFLSHLLPMLTLLLICLPMLALCYTFGGVTTHRLWGGIFMLALTCFQVGAMAILFSSASRTAFRAVIWTYAFGAVFYLLGALPFFVVAIFYENWFFLFPPTVFFSTIETSGTFTAVVGRSLPALASSVVFLWLAWFFLIRTVVRPRKSLDVSGMKYHRRRWTLHHQGRIRPGLPWHYPVAWMETGRSIVGRFFPFIFAFFCSGIGPVLLLVGVYKMRPVCLRVYLMWVVAVVSTALVGVNTMASERLNRTLDVLLVTPMTGHDIVLQKSRRLRRIFVAFPLFFLLLFFLESHLKGGSTPFFHQSRSLPLGVLPYWFISLSTVALYLPLFYWFSVWIGLQVRSHVRARMTVLMFLAAWAVLPLLLKAVALNLDEGRHTGRILYLSLLSPFSLVEIAESGVLPLGVRLGNLVAVNIAWHVFLLVFFRTLSLWRTDRYLGRPGTPVKMRELWNLAEDWRILVTGRK